jgi:hypothetical protein
MIFYMPKVCFQSLFWNILLFLFLCNKNSTVLGLSLYFEECIMVVHYSALLLSPPPHLFCPRVLIGKQSAWNPANQRGLNDLKRPKLSRAPPPPTRQQVVSLSKFSYVSPVHFTHGRGGAEGVGMEPNHTTTRMPGPV